ncbi:hypothetical protein, partial [Streptomyces sp. SBT349]|uniref:hypothetical protein n=1 Tax=Streptomyces sp. SBT349 TaxID=1580539 RepID=UPI000ADC263E
LGLTPSPNPSTYVTNPHTWSDPLGLAPCPANLALGIRDEGLRGFADNRGYTHYLDNQHTWENEVWAATRNPAVHLHISMDGFAGSTPAERFINAYREGSGTNWWATEREMFHVGEAIRREYRGWDSITFYENGKPVTVPEPSSWPRLER